MLNSFKSWWSRISRRNDHQIKRKSKKSPYWRRAVIGIAVFIALLLILNMNFHSSGVAIKPGQLSPRDIKSGKTIEIEDKEAGEKLRESAARAVEPVYNIDPKIANETMFRIETLFKVVKEAKRDKKRSEKDSSSPINKGGVEGRTPPPTYSSLSQGVEVDPIKLRIDSLKKMFPRLPDDTVYLLLNFEEEQLSQYEQMLAQIIGEIMKRGIRKDDLESARDELITKLNKLSFPQEVTLALEEIGTSAIQPNSFLDTEKTKQLQEKARDEIKPVMIPIMAGEIIIRQGEKVTEKDVFILKALGLYRNSANIGPHLFGSALLVFALMLITVIYLSRFESALFNSDKQLALLSIVALLSILIVRAAISYSPYLLPVALASLSLTMIFNAKLSLFLTVILSALSGLIVGEITGGGELNYMLVGFIGGAIGIYSVSKIRQITQLTKVGVAVISANILVIFGLELLSLRSPEQALLNSLWGVPSGLLSTVLTAGSLPLIENIFHITTNFKLLELASPAHPLLKRLLLEASGTYSHSIVIGNLAETAAEAVGANPLLARVGAYYHDIGKIKRPYFFIENQIGEQRNPHNKISPTLSFLTISSHVKDGVEMAYNYHLPESIIDIIRQHHGTNYNAYFYNKARDYSGKDHHLSLDDFRYEGPKPRTKEAAIIFLADSVEAATRSLSKPSPSRIRGMVREIIKSKVDDGQLDECDLTFRDIDKISQSFERILMAMFHVRLEYPKVSKVKSISSYNPKVEKGSNGRGNNKGSSEEVRARSQINERINK